jgi:hypothetical protein
MLSKRAYERMFRGYCIYDILALGPLVLPVVNVEHLATLSTVSIALGGTPWPEFPALAMMFVQMLGILGVAWSVWRWRAMSFEIGRFEGVLRLIFVAAMLLAYARTAQPFLLVFAVIDVVGGVLHLLRPKTT